MSSKFLDYTGLSYLVQKLAPKLIPNQSGQSGKVLTTDGTNASWASADAVATGTQQTNCVLEIPQNLSVTLVGSTLTLKKGSVVYVPNGKNNDDRLFNTFTLSADKVLQAGTEGSANGEFIVFMNGDGSVSLMVANDSTEVVASASDPSSGHHFWYDYTNNLMKYSVNADGNWVSGYSLPVCIVTRTNGVVTSVDEVFNGFGHMGGCVYVLPQVMFFVADGRKESGVLNSVKYTTSDVLMALVSSGSNAMTYYVTMGGALVAQETGLMSYDFASNYNYDNGTKVVGAVFAESNTIDGFITGFKSKFAFRAVDYNDLASLDIGSTAFEQVTYTISESSATPQSFGVGNYAFLFVFVDSVLAEYGVDYTLVDSVLTFTSVLPVDTEVTIIKCVNTGSVLDSELSTTSPNAVENKVVTQAINEVNADITGINEELDEKLGYDRVSNCITYIPQDIKLELSNGTLTLKAGSKIYIPNGSGVFNEVVTTADISWSNRFYSGTQMLIFKADGSKEAVRFEKCLSGDTTPTVAGFKIWYDTANNLVKFYNNSTQTWSSGWSLPVAIVTSTLTDSWSSIDQVFNGFGFIGEMAFALPNVQYLIPDGRNEDGTLRSVKGETETVKTASTFTDGGTFVVLNNGSIEIAFNRIIYESDSKPTRPCEWYNTAENKTYRVQSNGSIELRPMCRLFDFYASNKQLSNINTVSVLSRSDSSTIAGCSMPSSRYIDLSLGASGASYTAPANGWVTIEKASAGLGEWMSLSLNASGLSYNVACERSGYGVALSIPARKGDTFSVNYSLSGGVSKFRFIYAEGEV